MRATRFIAVGASAGGVESLRRMVAGLPTDLGAAVAVVLHLSPTSPSLLPQILTRAGPLLATHATDGEEIRAGHIYVAPPDHHLLVEDGHFRLSRGATENGLRPAIDVLFRSAASSFGPHAIGVVLSGSLDDGTAGLQAIKEHGGRAVVQEPRDATYPDMPTSALAHVAVDCVASAVELPHRLTDLLHEGDRVETSSAAGASDEPAAAPMTRPEMLTCPDCGGPLEQVADGPQLRFRCVVGHQWTELALEEAQVRMLENALYVALRIIDERVELTRRMLERAEVREQQQVVRLLRTRKAELQSQAGHLRAALGQADTQSASASGERAS